MVASSSPNWIQRLVLVTILVNVFLSLHSPNQPSINIRAPLPHHTYTPYPSIFTHPCTSDPPCSHTLRRLRSSIITHPIALEPPYSHTRTFLLFHFHTTRSCIASLLIYPGTPIYSDPSLTTIFHIKARIPKEL